MVFEEPNLKDSKMTEPNSIDDAKLSEGVEVSWVKDRYDPLKAFSRHISTSSLGVNDNDGFISRFLNARASTFEESQEDTDYDDSLKDMTWGRRLARYLSTNYAWYNPNDEGGPKLDAAWAYFEHFTLPRHHVRGTAVFEAGSQRWGSFRERRNKKDLLEKADYGERSVKTKMYHPVKTPEKELSDFGMGIGIYFWTLRVLSIICFLAGVLSISNMLYYHSDEYDNLTAKDALVFGIQLSAICTKTEWVPCPTCGDVRDNAVIAKGFTSNNLIFVLRNECHVGFEQAIWAFATLVCVVVSIIVMNAISGRREIKLDESVQTTSDYSITITNPPKDAYDVDEWKNFFEMLLLETPEVVSITVSIDNKELIRTLLKRRLAIRNLESLLKPGETLHYNDSKEIDVLQGFTTMPEWKLLQTFKNVPKWKQNLFGSKDATYYLKQIHDLEQRAHVLAEDDKNVNRVFVIFQTEKSQRDVLAALYTPSYKQLLKGINDNGISSKIKRKLFRGKHVLNVAEAAEPSAIHWLNLGETAGRKIVGFAASYISVLGTIFAGAVCVYLASLHSASRAALVIATINQIVPRLSTLITNSIESHQEEGFRQASIYIKTTIFKWVNTAIVTTVITPFVHTLGSESDQIIMKVFWIFIFELVTNPILLIADISGHLNRHILAPREKTQERMNLHFQGAEFSLAARYTELMKILFLAVFYSAIYPAGFFFASASMIINYLVDKFCLCRMYGHTALLGNAIAKFNRNTFFVIILVVYALMLSRDYAGFSFDNLCDTRSPIADQYGVGDHIVYVDGTTESKTVSVEEGDTEFHFCHQDMFRLGFPFLPKQQQENMKWMTDSQEQASFLLGRTSEFVVVLAAGLLLKYIIVLLWDSFFKKSYKFSGKVRRLLGFLVQFEIVIILLSYSNPKNSPPNNVSTRYVSIMDIYPMFNVRLSCIHY